MSVKLEEWFERMPAVAILRGVLPEEVVEISEALLRAGIGIIEVPMNSPEPLASIERLGKALGSDCVFGAGTVVTLEQAEGVAKAGGEIVVTPNSNPAIIKRSLELGMIPMPGWATATEAYQAYQAGARHLKLFPAATYGPGHVKAVRAAFPKDCKILAVGGVGARVAGEWLQAGIDGFGIGSELYQAGMSAEQVYENACKVAAAIQAARQS